MNLAYLSFTEKGEALANRLKDALGGAAARCNAALPLAVWTAENFESKDGLVFVGAAGIAVRAIAPHVASKTTDPAVVVVDECAGYAVPLLSGHLGGANDLARKIASVCGAIPVITTATDANGAFAVDEWAKRQNCVVRNPEKIKKVSAKILAGGTVQVKSRWPIAGEIPKQVKLTKEESCDVKLDLCAESKDALCLIPRIAVLGVGCKKGVSRQTLEDVLCGMLDKTGLDSHAIVSVASIDLKKEEPGLIAFCAAHGWPFLTYSAKQLQAVQGSFTSSDFVQSITGVDNVCERSAMLAAGGTLYQQKNAGSGVTMALALAPYAPDWRWQDE